MYMRWIVAHHDVVDLILQLVRRTRAPPLLIPPLAYAALCSVSLPSFSYSPIPQHTPISHPRNYKINREENMKIKDQLTSWNLHQQTNLAIRSPLSNSSKQITHSASFPSSSTQSFSVATYGTSPLIDKLIRLLLAPSPFPRFPAALLIPLVRWLGSDVDVCSPALSCDAAAAGRGGVDPECSAMQSSTCWVRLDSSPSGPLGGNSSPQTGHSSSSAIWRRGGGPGGGCCGAGG